MCGIIALQNIQPISEKLLNDSLNLTKHRGPDEKGVNFINLQHTQKDIPNYVSLGHNRLQITGVDNGKQPLSNEEESIWAVVNGEFYEFETIREDLIKKGHKFKTLTDSEVLIHLYEQYGTACIDFLHGEFAFALYDTQKNLWFIGRDRFGIKPLHWSKYRNNIYISSEAKALLPFIDFKLDREAFWFSQNFQYLPQNRSLFEHINMVKPGSFITLEHTGSEIKIKEHIYYNTPIYNNDDSLVVAEEKIEFLLNDAVAKRIPREVKFCAHLSGGIDSSSICALSKKHGLKDVFTISFIDDDFYNEKPFAEITSKYLDLNLHSVEVSFDQIINTIGKAVYHSEGLSINGHLSGKYLLNEAIHNAGFKVALSGEGSDEIFMGYSHLKQDYLSANSLSKMETNYLGGFQLPDGKSLDLKEIKDFFGFLPTWIEAKSSMAHKLSQLWEKEFSHNPNPNSWFIEDFSSSLGYSINQYSPMKRSSLAWTKYCLTGYILKVLDDAQSMAFAVEGRLPFLDTQLVNYVLSLPDEYYFSGNVEKNILRKIFSQNLPQQITQKTKQSFMSSPLTRSLKDEKNFTNIRDIINNSNFINQNLFDMNKVNNSLVFWKDNSSPAFEPILMTILCIAHFCEKFKL